VKSCEPSDVTEVSVAQTADSEDTAVEPAETSTCFEQPDVAVAESKFKEISQEQVIPVC